VKVENDYSNIKDFIYIGANFLTPFYLWQWTHLFIDPMSPTYLPVHHLLFVNLF